MLDRDRLILTYVVDEYIRSARPVGSDYLARIVPLTLSSATIRMILQRLEEDDYVYQPHTSAGRIPTDKGYRAYVDHSVPHRLSTREIKRISQQFAALEHVRRQPARTISQLLAKLAHTMVISAWLERGEVGEAGLGELLHFAEAAKPEVMKEVSALIEGAEEIVEKIAPLGKQQTVVFIGRENPVMPAHHTSLLVRTVEFKENEPVVLLLTGPKRMPYGYYRALLDTIDDFWFDLDL